EKTVEQPSKAREWVVDLPGLKEGETPLAMRLIPAGSFQMGSPESEEGHEENESPVHSVTISRDFYLGKYEITQAQWIAVMETNPSTEYGPNFPVNRVNWYDCQDFLRRLNKIVNKGKFRLPTEAEREYACRAGTTTMTYFGDNPTPEMLEEHAWMRTNSDGELHDVGLLKPNPWGLHDMLGNVWEWCEDWYAPYPAQAQVDPQGALLGTEKVFRGASWMARPEWIRCADRGKFTPDNRRNTGGFRIAYSD
ncbi:MAG: formylglycine-generating enzyme family protein, partial [Candidatus Hinthialibacter sp.]